MLRTSSLLAIALSATAIASATVPATAYPLQVFGAGSNHLAQLPAAAPVLTKPQASQEAVHVLAEKPPVSLPKIPTAPGLSSMSPGKVMMPLPKAGTGLTSVGNALDSCATNPKLCPTTTPVLPKPWPPHCEAMSGALLEKCMHPTNNNDDDDKDRRRNPILVVLPQAPAPVGVPVAVPYGTPARVATGSGSASAARAPAQPVVTPACITAADIPALAAGIDQLLPTAQLSEADMSSVTEFRQMIQVLATDGKLAAARDVEEVAMNVLGYQKVWLRCGLGTFEWEKQAATTQASQAK